MRRYAFSIAAAALLFGLCSCRSKEAAAGSAADPAAAQAAQAPAPAREASAGAPAAGEASAPPSAEASTQVPPLPSHAPALPVSPEQGPGAPPTAPNSLAPVQPAMTLVFALPAGWTSKPPSSSMRLAQATIDGPGGPAEMALFFFGPGQGGGVEDNLARWSGQVSGGKPRRGTLEAGGLKITWVDVAGTMKPTSMGMGPATEQPGFRLLGAVVEGPGGPWFFKATGPDSTLGPQRDAFLKMLRSVRLQQGQSA